MIEEAGEEREVVASLEDEGLRGAGAVHPVGEDQEASAVAREVVDSAVVDEERQGRAVRGIEEINNYRRDSAHCMSY